MRINAGPYANTTRLGTVYLDRQLDEAERDRLATALADLEDWRTLEWVDLDDHGHVVNWHAAPRPQP